MEHRAKSSPLGLKYWAITGVIGALLLECYAPALHGGLVWDDAAHVTQPALRSWAALARIWFEPGATQQYYPILHSIFWLEHRCWGDVTIGYHLANVVWHTLSCCLLASILQRLWRGPFAGAAAWLAAVLFAIHPVVVESVAWISEQKNTLSLVFYLLAARLYLDFDVKRQSSRYAGALLFFLLAIGTKSVTATLPAALLVALWWRGGRLAWRRDVVPLLPWFIIALVAGLFTVWAERVLIGARGTGFELDALQRCLLAGRIIWFYFGKLVWPVGLVFIYPRWDVPTFGGWLWWLVAVVLVTVALWLWWRWRGTRGPLAAWLFFIGSLFPALGFFNVYPFVFSYVADHFQYLPSIGILSATAWCATWSWIRLPRRARLGGAGVGGALLSGLILLSRQQCATYADAATLYRATLSRNPSCWMAHNNLAVILTASPSTEAEGIAHYRRAIALKPDYAEAHGNLAFELAKIPGCEAEAITHAEAALRVHPEYAEAHCTLGNILSKIPGRETEALGHYKEAVWLDPDSPEVHFCLANELAQLGGRRMQALAQYREALRLRPDYIEAHVNLANELAGLPDGLREALAHYEEVLRLDPSLAEVHYDLAVQLAQLPGREPDAMTHYAEAIRLRPTYAKAHNNLATLYAQHGDYAQAREHWEKALALNPAYEDARRNLSLLRHQLGEQ